MVACGRPNWLHEFRQCLSLPEDALECAKLAASYNPHGRRRGKKPTSNDVHFDPDVSVPSGADVSTCGDIVTGTVVDVYNCGVSAFVRSRDIQLDLAKVYLLLCKARQSWNNNSREHYRNDATQSGVATDKNTASANDGKGQDVPGLINQLMDKFKRYVVISVTLSERCPFDHAHQDMVEDEAPAVDTHQQRGRNKGTNFKIDPANYRVLFDPTDGIKQVTLPDYDSNAISILSWPFYRDATCSDVFKLMCYALMLGNFEAFDVILQNHGKCMLTHIKQHWKVLLSYVPVSCDYTKCRDVVQTIFRIDGNTTEQDYANVVDWILWRTYVILEVTKCSFYLAYKFLRTMSVLLVEVEPSCPGIRARQQFIDSVMAFMKQHIIVCNHNSGTVTSVQELEDTKQMTFREYLELKASEKLQLFCDCVEATSANPDDCFCEEIYKDKYCIYTCCLHCKTINGVKTLCRFFQLIKTIKDEQRFGNQFCELEPRFAIFYESVQQCVYASIDDYMEDIYGALDASIGPRIFEVIYILTKAMLTTDLRQKAHAIVYRVLFSRNFRYSVLENYFMYKSIWTLIEDSVCSNANATAVDNGVNLMLSLGDSYLGELCCTPGNSHITLGSKNPHYMEFLKVWKHAGGKLTYDLIKQVVLCQLNFVEALLNLLSLMRLPLRGGELIHISVDEITKALCSQEHAMLLMQNILLYILEQDMEVEDFRNCIYALNDIVSYISAVPLQDLHAMFFYTICSSSNNVEYLEAQCHVWFSTHNKGPEGVQLFLRESLRAAKINVYRLSNQYYVSTTLTRLITDLMYSLHVAVVDHIYFNHPVSKTPMAIHEVIGVYLDYLGVDWDGDIVNKGMNIMSLLQSVGNAHDIPDHDSIIKDIRSLGLFQRVSTALMTIECDMASLEMKPAQLTNRLYQSKAVLAQDTFGSLASVFFKKSEAVVPNSEVYWEFLIFAYTVSNVFPSGVDIHLKSVHEITQRVQLIKTVALVILPKEWRNSVAEIIEFLINLLQDGQPKVEPFVSGDKELCAIVSRLSASACVKSGDYVGLAKVFEHVKTNEMPELVAFLKEEVFNISSGTSSNAMDMALLDPSQITLFEVLTGPECDEEMNKDTLTQVEIDDFLVRGSILKLLSKVNLTKVEVYQPDKMKISFDKLAHRFTGNTASGLLSKALGKAETGLSSITLKKMQFETLKGKFFTSSKKNTDNFNGCYLPVLNFYNTAVLCVTNYDLTDPTHVDNVKAVDQTSMKWPSVYQTDVLQLIRMDTQLGVIRLLESCNFSLNMVFIEHLHRIFHTFNVHQCLRVLAVLQPFLKQFRWPQALIAHLETIEKFLKQFRNFPSETDIYIGRFISSGNYRKELFAKVATYILDNVSSFLHIYRCLDALFSCKQFDAESATTSSEPFDLDSLVGAIWTDMNIVDHFGIDDPLLMNEYISVLMTSFEKTIWESNPQELMQKIKCLEPDFLQLGEQYRDTLIAMYNVYLQKRMHKPGHWLLWRKLVCRFLTIYPEHEPLFGGLFRPGSEDVIRLLEVVERTTDGFDITEVDRFETFKRQLARKINIRNYYEISNAMRHVDQAAAKTLLESVHGSIRVPENVSGFNATRELYNYDMQTANHW